MDDAKKLAILSEITRASHFEWRRAAAARNPDQDPREAVMLYWEESARDAARYYLKKIDPAGDLADQVADLFVSSSLIMKETAERLPNSAAGHSRMQHTACPWFDWHEKEGLLDEDQAGCDHFIATLLEEFNAALGTRLRFSTESSLPAGQACCLRHFWVEEE
jgi:hypothetical protein